MQELFLAAMIILFCLMYIAITRGFISAMHGMELAIVRSVHVTWMYFVSQLTQKLELMVCQHLTRSLECPLHCAIECGRGKANIFLSAFLVGPKGED